MSTGGPPDSVLAFVDRHIESIETLEILLLLSEEERGWSVAEIFRRIQSSPASVEHRLSSLKNAALLKEEQGLYRFAPADDAMRAVVRDLAEAYREWRVRIIETIYSRKIDAVQGFADAFRFKKKE